jgi:hypothetical protein
MTKVESELLTALHRRWIETRDPEDGDRFAFYLAELTKADAKNRYPAFSE